ncbi:MAG: ribose 5-phosphate isomerase A [Acidobacteria bacterium RBG_16_64_8]|nr:MAG: ribose 5-phosphate isomerase A [Acidobacteria bacterium RBG_16_64_8]
MSRNEPHSVTQDEMKREAAETALAYVTDGVIGVGSGSTVHSFIEALSDIREHFDGAVSSSEETTRRLRAHGITVHDLNIVGEVAVYVDGADEVNAALQLVKGGGGALTREKIVAGASRRFVCIADESKLVSVLGRFPLPVEVIPMGRTSVARQLARLGGTPVWREGFVTDEGNVILDVQGLEIVAPIELERRINDIPGVVTVGIFAIRPADLLVLGTPSGPRILAGTSSDM